LNEYTNGGSGDLNFLVVPAMPVTLWAPFGLEITRHVGENEISTENEFKVR
jgi:hypothetical protein